MHDLPGPENEACISKGQISGSIKYTIMGGYFNVKSMIFDEYLGNKLNIIVFSSKIGEN